MRWNRKTKVESARRAPAVKRVVSAAAAVLLALGLASGAVRADEGDSFTEDASPVLQALEAELDRSLTLFAAEPVPPYYLAYEVTELDSRSVSSSFGLTLGASAERRRRLDVDLRVGSYELDNTHPIRGGRFGSGPRDDYSSVEVPLDDDIDSIRAVVWRATDERYKRAVERYTAVRTNVQVKVEETDSSPDFSAAEAVVARGPQAELEFDLEQWQSRVDRYTEPFRAVDEIYQAQATLRAGWTSRWFVNSDGSRIESSRAAYRLDVRALTKADDGMELPRSETFFSYTLNGLPSDEEVLNRVKAMISDLQALRAAPVVDPYAGPAILSGRAAAVFFHEVFGHRIEGHRQKREDEGQTFRGKIGEQILPAEFSVVFDPTAKRMAGSDLAGSYEFDNEGVPARPVAVVERGAFRHFLMSRSPIQGEPRSNGHGRREPGFAVVARQSNLIVRSSEPVEQSELRAELLKRIKASGKPFGLIFEDIQGGFTQTGRRTANAFNVLPIIVYRLFPDGREELVRGVDLIGTPLTAFSRIVAADDRLEVFNGTCGAESGGVPVAGVAPGILIEQIEIQRKEKSQDRPPLLPAPAGEEGA